MSIFDTGFIFWGFFAVYVLVVVAYLLWARVMNRKEERAGTARATTHDNGGEVSS